MSPPVFGLLLRRKYRQRWTSNSRLRGLGHGFKGYAQSEGLQAGDEALLDAGGVPPVEVVLAEFAIRGAVFQDVVGDHEDAVARGYHSLLLAPPAGERIGPTPRGSPACDWQPRRPR